MVHIENPTAIIVTVGLLIVFMFFGFNLFMMVLERKISFSELEQLKTQLSAMLSKTKNPKEYKLARLYLWGSISTLIGFMAYLELGYA